ncbi:MAG: MmgE/PrpD family protein, partial [Rhodospirillaceae bacterium]|nr:MmgE/PrpD family protein [Rhodospirillaceae bacterium]
MGGMGGMGDTGGTGRLGGRQHSLGETLAALVTGFEVGGRMGEYLRIRPGMHVDGIWGTFGATAGAARLLGHSAATTVSALQGTACQLPYSLYLPITQGATVRNAYVGEAARRGIFQAMAAAAGITTPTQGAVEAFDRSALAYDGPAKKLAPPGEWLISQGYLKPYAAVRHVHYGAQAAIDWRRQQANVDTRKIEALQLSIYGEAMTYCGNRAPTTPIQAQFSLSYGLAWALTAGDLGPDAYHDASLMDGEVRRLEALVVLTEATDYTARNQRAARLTITYADSKETVLVDAVPGEVDMPLPADEVEAKFIRYVTPILGQACANKMAQGILNAPLSSPLVGLLAI